MASWKLNDEQRRFAAEKHDEVVLGFLSVKRLDKDEYLDVVYEKYLYAVYIYLERPELRRYSFKTIAYRQMMSAVKDYWTYLNRDKQGLSADLSLKGLRAWESSNGASFRLDEYADAADQWRQIEPLLTEKEVDALRFKAIGYTYPEIAEQVGITSSGVGSRFYRMRLRLKRGGLLPTGGAL